MKQKMRSQYLVLAAVAAGCAHQEPFVWVDDLPEQALTPAPYHIQPGDEIAILVWNQEHLSARARIRSDGAATLPLVGDVRLAGATAPAAAQHIGELLRGLVIDPKVTVTVVEPRPPSVAVIGEVREPGTIPLASADSILNVIAKAGGLTEFADEDEIFVLRQRPERLRVRFDFARLTGGVSRGVSFPLQDGDVVVVR